MQELEVHTTIEEEILYPTVTDLSEEIHETVVEGIEEARKQEIPGRSSMSRDELTATVAL